MASRQATSKSEIPQLLLTFAGMLVLAFSIYAPAIRGPFIWDDGTMVYDNQFVRAGNGLVSIWSGKDVDYFPMTSTVFWFEWRLFGDNPAGYRVINILLHASSAFLIWRILKRLRVPGAGIAATIFCVHPVCVGTVAWVAELKNTLSLFLALLSVLLFLRARPNADAKRTGQGEWNGAAYLGALFAFALVLLSKISVVMLPFALLTLVNWRKLSDLVRIAPFFLLSLTLGLLNVWFQNHHAMATVQSTDVAPLLTRVLGGGYAVWFYCAKLLLPLNLMPIYPRWNIVAQSVVAYLPALVWILLLMLLWALRGKASAAKTIFYGLMFFTVMAIPVLGIVPMSFLLQTQVADHLQYFPMIGVVAVIGYVVVTLASRFTAPKRQSNANWNAHIVGACLILLCTIGSFAQARLFGEPESLWRDNARKNPFAPMVWANLGDIVCQRGKYDEAINDYRRSIELDPDNVNVRENLAKTLNQTGRIDEALEQLRAIATVQPKSAHVHNNIGTLLQAKGQLQEAIEEFRIATKIAPSIVQTHINLGAAYATVEQYDNAVKELDQVLRIDPQNSAVREMLERVKKFKNETSQLDGRYSSPAKR